MHTPRWLIILLLIPLLAGCRGGPDRCSTDRALLVDNFNDDACGWDEYAEEAASAGLAASEYFIAVHQPNTSAVSLPGGDYSNLEIVVDVRQASGSANNNYGLLCRYRDMDHFYAFLISSDGYYAIVRVAGGGTYKILSGDGIHLLPSEAINTEAGATNEVSAVCDGDTLTLFVNGRQLTSVSDSELTSGDVGFIASTYEEAAIEIRFDNLRVYATEPAGQSD